MGLAKSPASACWAYSSAFAATLKVTTAAFAYQACSFEAKLKVVHPATAKESPSAYAACSAFAGAESEVRPIALPRTKA